MRTLTALPQCRHWRSRIRSTMQFTDVDDEFESNARPVLSAVRAENGNVKPPAPVLRPPDRAALAGDAPFGMPDILMAPLMMDGRSCRRTSASACASTLPTVAHEGHDAQNKINDVSSLSRRAHAIIMRLLG